MQVLFRADASLEIGTGHIIRCLTLADSLNEHGAKCEFICRVHDGNLIEYIRSRGFDVWTLPNASLDFNSHQSSGGFDKSLEHRDWLGVPYEQDASQCLDALRGRRFDLLIVDHYGLDQGWESIMRCMVNQIFVIDDLADRMHDCDMLLDQNLGRTLFDYESLVPSSCHLLIGPNYALLRPEFHTKKCEMPVRESRTGINRILVTMGGVDRDNITTQVLDALSHATQLLPLDCLIQVVMGATAPWLSTVKDKAAQLPFRCEVLVNVTNMADLMAQADLAIGAVGITAWERCCLGLPTLAVILAENQRIGAENLASIGAIALLPREPDMIDVLNNHLIELSNQLNISRMQNACYKITDGMGTWRVIDLLKSELVAKNFDQCCVREMSARDLQMVLRWRNHPNIKIYMHSQHEISEFEHRQWFQSASNDPRRRLLIYEDNNEALGFIQFSGVEMNGRATWGFYLAPDAISGTGYRLGQVVLNYAFDTLGLEIIYGEVIFTNERSIRFHEKLGFQRLIEKSSENVLFELTKSSWIRNNEGNINE
jgi:UDP-2,4-diacetamido-2,4,6-trideoxy-beta-L-altropyranose hydrolase/UDP-4-amino-4,6-dideoxy-N-acetyl-beta-L-altrosamine N-acetyltransferase